MHCVPIKRIINNWYTGVNVMQKFSLRKFSHNKLFSVIDYPPSEKRILYFVGFIFYYVSATHKPFYGTERGTCGNLSVCKWILARTYHLKYAHIGFVEIYPDAFVIEVVKEQNSVYCVFN